MENSRPRSREGGHGGPGGSRGGPRRGGFGGGPRRSFGGPREMHKAVCAECNKECEVPFKPTEGRPVYCKDCFMKKRDQERGMTTSPKAEKTEEAAEEESEEEM